MNTDAPDSTSGGVRALLRRLPPTLRGHTVAVLGEFVGTTSFLFFAFAGTQVANISSNTNTGTTVTTTVQQKNPSELLYISLAFGFALATNAWVFFRISGGLFNPAVCELNCFLSCLSVFVPLELMLTSLTEGHCWHGTNWSHFNRQRDSAIYNTDHWRHRRCRNRAGTVSR